MRVFDCNIGHRKKVLHNVLNLDLMFKDSGAQDECLNVDV